MKTIYAVPFIIMLVMAGFFAFGLNKGHEKNALDMRSNGREISNFSLPILDEKETTFSPQTMRGHVSVINVFASWCVPCVAEHPLLMELSKHKNVKIYGIAWKDAPEKISAYLEKNGNPFSKVAIDQHGKSTIALALTGVPETLIIDSDGKILFHYKSALTKDIIDNAMLPLLTP